MNEPDNLPPLPPVPPGFDRWVCRGPHWKPGRECVWTTLGEDGWIEDEDNTPSKPFGGSPEPYIEAVREPATGLSDEDHAAIVEAAGASADELMMPSGPSPTSTRKAAAMSDRPTPDTDSYYWCLRKQRESLVFARDLERQRDEAREILAATLKALPVGYLPAHTPESIPERVADLVARYTEAEREREEYAKTLRVIAESNDRSHHEAS